MAAQTSLTRQANGLIDCYINEYKAKYEDREPMLNRYRERWGFQSMAEDLGYARAKEVIAFYFRTGRVGHPVQYLLFNYDKLNKVLTEIEQDELKRAQLRAETEERVRMWSEKYGND